MKRILFLAAGLLLTLAACQKTELLGPASAGLQTISVTVPQGISTKVTGDGTQVNRCILEVYRDGALYGERMSASVIGGKATFDLRLVSNQTYDFVFWADKAESGVNGSFTDLYYATDNLSSIKAKKAYVANDEGFDAFTYCEKGYKVTGAFNLAVTLKRPFGQLNVKTLDLGEIKDESLKPTNVKVAFKSVPTAFNALTGEAGEEAALAYETTVADAVNGLLTVDYILASETEGATLADFTMTFLNNGTAICTNDAFTNIPLRRNYKTNVSGNLLTKKGEFNVTIVPGFETPDYDEVFGETATVATVTDVEDAIKNGARKIIVKAAPLQNANIKIPHTLTEEQAFEKISITVPETDKDIMISYTDDRTGKPSADVELVISTTGKLVIDLPESTVTLKGNVGSLEVSTADNTLIIPERVTVGSLLINKGNVEIYGKVGDITFNQGAGIVSVYGVGDAETLKKAAALVAESKCAKIVLTANIDLKGSKENPWTPIDTENKKFTEFDGQGHIISNLYINNYDGTTLGGKPGYYYGGLFYVLQGDVRNLTVETADVTCHRGGVLVGRMDFGTVENCHIQNATVKSIQKIAGLVGFISNSTKPVTIKGSSVDGLSISTLLENDGLWQAGGLVGYLQAGARNVLIQSNLVSNILLGKVSDGIVDAPSYGNDLVYVLEQNYSHAFIGTIANVSQTDNYSKYSVELKDNKVDKQLLDIPVCDRTDDFIGWWAGDYNASGYPYSGKIIVDGVEKNRWIEVERLVAKLREGGDIIIWRNYDFTKWPGSKTDSEQIVESPIELTKPTNITIKDRVVWTVGKQQLVNKSELTIRSTGKMVATDYVFMNEAGATLTIESGTYRAEKATDVNGTVIYNQGILNIKGGSFDGPGFTVMNTGNANMTLDGGSLINGGTVTSYSLMAAGPNAKITINGGKVDALQSIGRALVTINGGTVVNDSKFYAIYNEGGNTVVNGGYISGAAGYDDVYIAGGKVEIKGGCFEDNKAKAAKGFVYREKIQTVGDITYNWEVVPENL